MKIMWRFLPCLALLFEGGQVINAVSVTARLANRRPVFVYDCIVSKTNVIAERAASSANRDEEGNDACDVMLTAKAENIDSTHQARHAGDSPRHGEKLHNALKNHLARVGILPSKSIANIGDFDIEGFEL